MKFLEDKIIKCNTISNSKTKKILVYILFYLTCLSIFLTIIGQIFTFTPIKITHYFEIGWLLLLIPLLLLDYRNLFIYFVKSFMLFVPFLLYCFVALCLNINPFSFRLTINILLCLYIFALGIYFSKYFNISFLKYISFVFIASSLIYGLTIFFTKIIGHIDAKEIYAFDDKNSAGPIFLTAGLLSFFVFDKNKISHYIIKFSVFTFFTCLIVFSKCRACIICIPIVLFIFHAFIPKGKRKILSISIFTGGLALGIILLLTVPFLYKNIVVHFFFNDKKTIAEIFSGRLELIQKAISLLNNKKILFFGTGGYYVDCMPISLLVSYGIIGTAFLLPIASAPIYLLFKTQKQIKTTSNLFVVELCILIVLYINSLFECYGFIGPGAKVFFLWLISGFMSIYLTNLNAKY